MKKLKDLMKKHKGLILYAFFGVATTIVNIVAYYMCAHWFSLSTVISTCIAWVIAVLFAYITNRIWVFESQAHDKKKIIKEIISFFTCRLLTGFLDVGIMWLFVDKLKFNDIIIKTISNILVIVINYIASKLIIFKK